MSDVRRWRDTQHLDRAIDTAGGRDAFDSEVGKMLDDARRVHGRSDWIAETGASGSHPDPDVSQVP